MRSRIFQLRRHQIHSTFPLSQAEFAFYFYPFAFVLIIPNLDHCTAVPIAALVVIVLVVLLVCRPDDHLVDFCQNLRRQTLPKMHHGGRIEGWLAVIVARIPKTHCKYGFSWICKTISSSE